MSPMVTIGVCVKNAENTLKDTLQSISLQDYPIDEMEMIFVDDGSVDETLKIIQLYAKESPIKSKIFSHSWKGLGKSRNIIINNSKGKYIIWVDGDMYLSLNYIRELVTYMENNPDVGIAKGKHSLKPTQKVVSTLEIYSRHAQSLVDFNKTTKSMGSGGAMYRFKSLKRVKGFNEKIKGYGEDHDIQNRIQNSGWKVSILEVTFQDYERYGMTWKNLWQRYYKRGYDFKYMPKYTYSYFRIWGSLPPLAFIAGLIHFNKVYKITRDKLTLLLPIQYFFKAIAWWHGYMRARI